MIDGPDLFSFPSSPGHRGVETSVAAAVDMAPKVGRLQKLVLDEIAAAGAHGRTTNELADLLGIGRDSIQPRTSELRAQRMIGDSGRRRQNANGKSAIVWVASSLLRECEA